MGTRINSHAISNLRENMMAANNRKIVTRSTRARAALGDIGNKALIAPGKAQAGLKQPLVKGTSKYGQEKKVKKIETPTPMEVEDNVKELTNAFSSQQLTNVEDIDLNDFDNPQLCSEYVNDIYRYLRELELKYPVRQNYLEDKKITEKMRKILIDWLIQVHLRFRLLQETLYLTIDILNRYLQEQEVSKSKLQLVGVSAMFVASKYEEIFAPEIGDFVYITDNAYTASEILKTEQEMMRVLNFSLGKPLPLHFLRRYSKAGNADGLMHSVAKYLMELSLTEYEVVHHTPSELAGAALCLSMKILNQDSSHWSNTLIHYSGFKERDLLPLMSSLAKILKNSDKSKYQAVRSKYSSSKFMKLACLPEFKTETVTKIANYNI